MSGILEIHQAGPALSIQDAGRPGYARFGLSAGGAMDTWALAEGEALLGNSPGTAALEMAGFGGRFGVRDGECRIALTGAAMQAKLDGQPIPWRSSLDLRPGQLLDIGPVLTQQPGAGTYGYLHVAGGFDTPREIGARGTHLRAGVGGLDGGVVPLGAQLPVGGATVQHGPASFLPDPSYLSRRTVRVVWGPQSHRFSEATRQRLLNEEFRLSHRRDRMAMRLDIGDGEPYEALLTGLSDPAMTGDIQITGDGVPAILMREHQPTGGYPRIATVISADLCLAAQLPTGQPFRFELVTLAEAVAAWRTWQQDLKGMTGRVKPMVLGIDQLGNLLDYNLIDGVISARDE